MKRERGTIVLIIKLLQTSAETAGFLETQEISEQLKEDLAQLQPNVVLETLKSWTPALMEFAYRLLAAVIILLIGMKIAKMVNRFLKKTFSHMSMDIGVSKFLLSVANVGIYTIVLFMAADKVGIPSASIIAMLGSAGLAIGLALQGSLSNVAGGILILVTRPFGAGDYIVLNGVEGTVDSIGLTYTTLRTGDNRKITIPNGTVSNATIINVTSQEKRRVDVAVGIGYSSNLKQAKEIIRNILETQELVLKDEEIKVFVSELGDSAVTIGARAWTKTGDYWTVKWDVTEQIKESFDAAGIEIPFNQMDVNVRHMD